MALKYRFNLKDIKLQDFKVYLVAMFKGILPKKKIKNIEYVKEYYGCSNEKAKVALDVLSDEQIKTIKDSLNKGGKNGK